MANSFDSASVSEYEPLPYDKPEIESLGSMWEQTLSPSGSPDWSSYGGSHTGLPTS